eukprot:CAMPEP_0170097076 /NCGR_PEP_ID=MMETSP0019_2-20121128/28993_1 /TAXON_ID=98059 /ORGANISM="Dinobryon sp., Strain UTEXLB2267" /LENGTH=476 /DNA_ID=CAMNT_0010319243 /DNA_START=1605 /DNA_END=3032 /DNA_ORIENTATION=-
MAEKCITQADVSLIYTAVKKQTITSTHLQKANSAITTQVVMEKSDKLSFEEFISCLIKISFKCYPSSLNKEEAMQHLLMDNILPLANKRNPIGISKNILKQPNMESMFSYYEDALMNLYIFFAITSENSEHRKNMIVSTCSTGKTFDEQAALIEESKLRTLASQSNAKSMGYSSFMKFANDFGLLSTSLNLTNVDIGDIYLTVISFNNFSTSIRKIDFKEFWECIVRSALKAFQAYEEMTSDQKLKELLLHMWRHTQSNSHDHMLGYGTLQGGGFNTHKGSLLKVSQLFSEKFTAAWAKDEYRDYLVAPVSFSSPQGKAAAALIPSTSTPNRAVNNNSSLNLNLSGFSNLIAMNTSTPLINSGAKTLPRFIHQLVGEASLTDNNSSINASSNALLPQQPEDSVADLLHTRIESRTDYLVSTPDTSRLDQTPVCIRVQISDNDDLALSNCGSHYLKPANLRKLLYLNPHLALILHDC